MAHRDDVEALRARIEAQERELRDAKAELDVLRAAAYQRAHEEGAHDASALLPSTPDESDDRRSNPAPPFGAFGFGPTPPNGPTASPPPSACSMGPLRAETQRRLGMLILLLTTLVAGLFLATQPISTRCGTSRHRAASRTRSAVPVAADDGAAWSPFVRFARVVDPGAPAAVDPEQMCAVEVTPVTRSAFDCRVVVRCDDQVLYGEGEAGYNHCGPVPSLIVDSNVTAGDGDPRFRLDLASGEVVIEETLGLGIQRVELELLAD